MLCRRREVLEELQESKIKMSANVKDSNIVFKTPVADCAKQYPNQWNGSMSTSVIVAGITNLTGEDAKPIVLTPAEEHVIEVMCRPTRDGQMLVIKRIIEDHGGKLDADTEKNITRVVNAGEFKKELVKAGIIKDPGSDDLKGLLG
jgi:hypothetical protein